MVLKLHIWGPAFDLPSIDAYCLAAIAYLRRCLPSEAWVLIPSSDPTVSPFNQLPALKAGDRWVAGYGKIVDFLRDFSDGDWDLDKDLSLSDQGDATAFTSLLESRGQPLLDLSLYVSSENYTTCTRPGLGEILSWPNSWVLPHRLRDNAKKRSEHLGLSGLDVDTAQDDKSQGEGLTAHIPQSLRKPRHTVSSLLGRDVRKNRFRLDAVTEAFLEPMDEMLGDQPWILRDHPTSVDCLAVGLLALMQGPSDLPHPWLREAMRSKYPRLGNWTRKNISELLGDPKPVSKSGPDKMQLILPWQRPGERRWPEVLNTTVQLGVDFLPFFGSRFVAQEIGGLQDREGSDRYRQKQMALAKIQKQRLLYSQIVGSSICISLLAGTLFWKGMLNLPRRPAKLSPRSFGEAGSLLGLG